MKTYLFILLVVSGFGIGTFQASNAALLAGSWKFRDLKAEYPKTMHGKALADAKKDIQGDIKRMKNSPFIFAQDGKCTIGEHHGTWTMSRGGKKVTYINEKKEKEVVNVLQLSEHKLVFSRVDDSVKQTFILTK